MNNTYTYVPQDINDIVFSNDNDRILIEQIITGKYPFPAFGKNGILLYGPPALARLRLLACSLTPLKTRSPVFRQMKCSPVSVQALTIWSR